MFAAISRFAEWGSCRYAARTVETYSSLLRRFALFVGGRPAEDVTLDDVIAYYRHLRGRDCHDATIAYSMIAIRQLFRLLFLERKVSWNYELIGVPKYVHDSFVAVEPLEGWRMSEKVAAVDFRTLRDKTMLSFLYASGVRVSELVGLTVADIRVDRSFAVIASAKNRVRRMVFWDCRTACLMGRYLPQRRDVARCGCLFVSMDRRNRGGRLTTRSVERLVASVRDRREVTPHSFRHGLGMRAVKSGIHARHIQKILGHKSIASSQCYMDVDDDDLAAAYGRISGGVLTTSGEVWDN